MAKILIIDDESNIRMMLRLALEHVGHVVELASDGYEGLVKFAEGSGWDLILLDHRMPDMTGIDVLKVLRSRRADCRVILITAFGTVDLAADAMQAGATDFLRKPFTIEVLREAVDAALVEKPSLVAPLSFERVSVNGYRLVTLPGLERLGDGTLSKTFSVQKTEGAGRACRVRLLPSLQDQVQQSGTTRDASFWEALCGEALANYLWQNAALPPGSLLVIEELTSGLRRWIDTLTPRTGAA